MHQKKTHGNALKNDGYRNMIAYKKVKSSGRVGINQKQHESQVML